MTSGNSGNCKVGDYMSHPAFLAFGVKGLWVGKFETGYKGATSVSGAQSNSVSSDKIQIKPNVYSWRGIQVANAHLNSYNYKREMDSHLMKSTEWGAVAYLQQSINGSRSSVRINNNSSFITGYAAKNEPTCGYTADNRACNVYEGTSLGIDGTNTYNYKNPLSVSASTTNNYSGVYDMSGGATEYVMGVMLNQSGVPCAGESTSNVSGFAGPYCGTSGTTTGVSFPEEKYYDQYAYGTSSAGFKRRILGDATGEMGPFANVTYASQIRQVNSWYQNESWRNTTELPWSVRGGGNGNGTGAGVFNFGRTSGAVNLNRSFRIVLAL